MRKKNRMLAVVPLYLRRKRLVPERRKQWIFNLLSSLFIALFMLCVQPFELFLSEQRGMNYILAGYGLLTFALLLLFTHCLPCLFPRFFAGHRWTEGKQLLLYLGFSFTWGTVGCCYTHCFVRMPERVLFVSLLHFQGYSLQLFLFPFSFLELYVRNVRFKRLWVESVPAMPVEAPVEAKPEDARLSVGSGKSGLSFFPDELCYIEASGNYIRVVLCRQGRQSNSLVRCSISEAQRQTGSLRYIVRCHRRYIVNIRNAAGIRVGEHDLFLFFPQSNIQVPLSRDRAAAVKALFAEERQGK